MTRLERKENLTYDISDEVSKRINIYKLWLTIMVIFIHSYSEVINLNSGNIVLEVPTWLEIIKYTISQSISRCAVPAFFLISSIFLYRKDFRWTDNLIKKTRTLLVPYFILNTFWIVFYFVFQHIPMLSDYFSNPSNIVANWGVVNWLKAYGILSASPFLYPLWFIKYLFILNIFAVVIKKVVEKFPYLTAITILGIWLIFEKTSEVQALCFWVAGCFIYTKGITPDYAEKIKKVPLAVVYLLLVVVDTLTRELYINNFINSISILVGIAFWYVCCTDFKDTKWRDILYRLSSYAFPIYLFHEMNLYMLKKVCAKLLPQAPIFQLIQYFAIPAIIFVGCIILSRLMQKYSPKLYTLLTGNRSR